MAITIIFAPPGFGKTSFMVNQANKIMYDRERTQAMWNEILYKQQCGFTSIKTLPPHCVSSNFDIEGFEYYSTPMFNRRINPFRLGFYNKYVKTHFNIPYEAIFITEAQKYLNSRMSKYFPDWQSRWYEQHRHDDIDIYLDTQRPMLIDANVRELASFIEIVGMDVENDQFGEPVKVTWKIRKIPHSRLFDIYMASGQKDTSCYTEEYVTADYNVFACYNEKTCKPKFYEGHMDEDFDLDYFEPSQETAEAYVKWLKERDDEMPENYRIKAVA